jgi:hypothetical protein
MRKLIVLTAILLTSLSSFSQTDTTKVRISSPIARLVIKDLVKYDGAVLELKATQDKVVKLEEREGQKDGIIKLLEDKVKNTLFIVDTQKKQLNLSAELTEKLNKELKGQRRKTFLYKAGTVVGLVTTSYLLIK